MLLQQKGYPASTASTPRAAGRLPGHVSRPVRRRAGRASGARPADPRRCGCGPTSIGTPCVDQLHGDYTGVVDDFVVRRGDGVPAYNLAVVVDDAAAGIDQVVRGDDLLPSSPRQAYLACVLGYPQPAYAHVSLVLNHEGQRLAKRDDAVTLAEIGVQRAISQISASLGWPSRSLEQLLSQFDPSRLPREPWLYSPSLRRNQVTCTQNRRFVCHKSDLGVNSCCPRASRRPSASRGTVPRRTPPDPVLPRRSRFRWPEVQVRQRD